MSKRIKITEGQLKGVVNILNEQNFDDVLTKYQQEKERAVYMSQEDAKLLLNLAQNWCEGRVDHPDCEEVERITKKLRL